MQLNDLFPSRFLTAADLQGQDCLAVIDRVETEDFDGQRKAIVFFQGRTKGVVLNKTNFSSIAEIAGDDTDDWQGARIVLFPMMVSFQGQTREAIRIRRAPAPTAEREASTPERPPATATPTPAATGKTPPFDDAIEL